MYVGAYKMSTMSNVSNSEAKINIISVNVINVAIYSSELQDACP